MNYESGILFSGEQEIETTGSKRKNNPHNKHTSTVFVMWVFSFKDQKMMFVICPFRNR